MDYLDELDDSAMQALLELGGNLEPQTQPAPPTSASTSASTPASSHLSKRCSRRVEATYLLRLDSPLLTPRHVADALRLSRLPQLETGTGEDGEALFCRLPQSSINKLDAWAGESNKKLTKIRLGLAHRDVGELPLLGRDPTLPHHRPSLPAGPSQHRMQDYPVQYFFYGTLSDPERLERLFGIPAALLPRLRPATLLDGRIQTWASKYRAVVDRPGDRFDGFAFPVMSSEQEDALRVYEGDSYEVVAARIVLEGKEVIGRTFRFAGFEDELTG
jgi:hypothetical protein